MQFIISGYCRKDTVLLGIWEVRILPEMEKRRGKVCDKSPDKDLCGRVHGIIIPRGKKKVMVIGYYNYNSPVTL